MNYIGIDPGVNGSYTVIKGRDIDVYPFDNELEPFKSKLLEGNNLIWMERVWSSPNQSCKASFTFGENLGFWKGFMQGLGVDIIENLTHTTGNYLQLITPYEWQNMIGTTFARATYTQRKKYLKEICKSELEKAGFSLKITLKNADSVLIALALQKHFINGTDSNKQPQ